VENQKLDCIFCGNSVIGQRSKEHIVPQWALAEFGLRNELVLSTHFDVSGKVLSDRLHSFSGLLAGRVCGPCNYGWMSRLETENKFLITELGHGRRDLFGLKDDAAVSLARWAFKTALALHAASNYRKIIPEDHYRHMVRDPLTLPPNVHVVGKTWPVPCGFSWVQGPSWWIHQSGRELTDDEKQKLKCEGYKICLCLSQLFLLVAFNPLPNTRVLMWKFLHIPLYPRRGPVAWLQREPDLPNDDRDKAVIAFHGSFGLYPE
jgi:hypothetical protein